MLICMIVALLVMAPICAIGQPCASYEIVPAKGPVDIEALKIRLQGFNWVNPETDIVLIGEVASVETAKLKLYDSGPTNLYGRFKFEACRWIMGESERNIDLYHSTFVFWSEGGELMRQITAGQSWLMPGERMIIVASPVKAKLDGDDFYNDILEVRYVRYLSDDCSNETQQVYENRGYDFDYTLGKSDDLATLTRECITIKKSYSGETLGGVLAEIEAAAKREEGR
jgi:hypothetical protein